MVAMKNLLFCNSRVQMTGGTATRPVLIRYFYLLLFLLCVTGSVKTVTAQSLTTGDPMEFYLRWVVNDPEIEGLPSFQIRSLDIPSGQWDEYLPAEHPWSKHPWFNAEEDLIELPDHVFIYSPQMFYSNNSDLPTGQNDGALWQGRGSNIAITTGLGYRYGPIRLMMRPVFVHSENRAFELSDDPQHEGLSPYAMALTYADIPQRFGDEPFSRFDLGDSYLDISFNGWTAGISNERIWSGPAVHNPLLFSSNAPGFLHGFLEMNRNVDFLQGNLEARWFWGGLRESEYFDEDPSNDLRYITGFLLNYSPGYVPGLHVGISRAAVSYYPETGFGFSELLMALRPSPYWNEFQKTDPENARFAMGSIFARWVHAPSGFEVYAEWGRNDHRRILRDLVMEPELNRGYVFGLIKRFSISPRRKIIFNAEMTNLENSTVSSEFRPESNIWYTHDIIQQGFTHRGQVLGAGIGPGSSTEYAGISYYDTWGMAGAYAKRIVYHNDRLFRHREYYHSTLPRPWMSIRWLHEVEMRYGLYGLVFLPYDLELQVEYHYGKIENYDNNFDRTRGGFGDDILFDETNSRVAVTLRVNLPGWRR